MKAYLGRYPKGDKERKISIRIDKYDLWGMDHTLALLIVPMLKMLKEHKQGVPHVHDVDVPEELRANGATDEYGSEPFEILEKKWEYVLGEMLWSMEEVIKDYDDSHCWDVPGEIDRENMFKSEDVEVSGYKTFSINWKVKPVINEERFDAYHKRVKNGHTLFGKYFSALWT